MEVRGDTVWMTWLAVIAIGVAMVASGWALSSRFQQGAETRARICRSENTLRKVLLDEHKKRLANQQQFLREHPNGIQGIPRRLIVQGIRAEKLIIAQVALKDCT